MQNSAQSKNKKWRPETTLKNRGGCRKANRVGEKLKI